MQGNSPCHHGYMAVALVKQQKGTAYPREMTHSWCRNNFSCREDTPYLLRPGRGHVLMPGATEGWWVVLHMASMVPLESQHRLRTSPTHLLLRGSKQSGSPCWFHFLLYIREHRAAQKNVIQGVFQPQLKLFQALMHVSHSQHDHICSSPQEKRHGPAFPGAALDPWSSLPLGRGNVLFTDFH